MQQHLLKGTAYPPKIYDEISYSQSLILSDVQCDLGRCANKRMAVARCACRLMAIAVQRIVMGTIDNVQLRRVPARLACICGQTFDAGRKLGWRIHGELGVRADRVPAVRQGCCTP